MYRYLVKGDIIKDGDEYLSNDTKWYKAINFFGLKWNEREYMKHRRKLHREDKLKKILEIKDEM